MKFFKKVFGTKHERDLKLMRPIIQQINQMESKIKPLSDADLQAKTAYFREKLSQGATLEDILVEAFAVCREAAWRQLNMRHYDVQLIGGLCLHSGKIGEMRTGEGKTLVATLPSYLNGLSGKGVHVVTVNDYLATRDCEWMGEVYRWLGLTTGTIHHGLDDQQRKKNYAADITYATNNELGFDYLRDNMKFDLEDYVQRPLNYALIDECDSILIDEARTPLIISGPSDDSTEKYYEINKIIPSLVNELHFTMEEKSKTVSLTEEGNSKCEELLKVGNLYDPEHIQTVHLIYQGLKAHHLFHIDKDYMVKNGEIMIVDEFTGRLMEGRRWSEGLHQAMEAKEGLNIKGENQTLASITFQNYFRMYNKLSGMTGTAETEAVEFSKIYDLDVLVIPTNKPILRKDREDVIYKTDNAKYNAIAKDIQARSESGQPVLVGTVSIERSERISNLLKKEGIVHNVLNAKHHENEAEYVAQAGAKGRITIATNMAGRGTDIVLGGNPEFLANKEFKDDWTEEQKEACIKKYAEKCEADKKDVIAAGGLCIIGTERHESRRIDNQLRGRAGRQGDPGESSFYLSLEDDLMRIFNGERLQKIMTTLNVPEDEPITAKMVSRSIEGAQRKVEGHHFDIRKHLLEYDDVMNQQRTNIYSMRRLALEDGNLDRQILDFLGDATSDILDNFANPNAKTDTWNIPGLNVALSAQFGVRIDEEKAKQLDGDGLTDYVSNAVKLAFDTQKETLGEYFDQVQKMVLLQTIDVRWKEHLALVDQLKEGINLRAYAQKDPLIEYKKEAFKAYDRLNEIIKAETIEKLMKIQLVEKDRDLSETMLGDQAFDNLDYEGGDEPEQFAGQMPQQNSGQMQTNRGPGGGKDEGPLNRAERRRREKLDKKRRR